MSNAVAAITIRFRGVRGSHPMPGAGTIGYGGNTSCQEIRAGGRLLVFDAGTGIIGLGRDLAAAGSGEPMALFLSHYHHDHIDGLLYFRPAYRPETLMHVFGPADGGGLDVVRVMERLSSPAAHPVPFDGMAMRRTTEVVEGGDVVVWRKGAPAPERVPAAPSGALSAEPEDVVVRIAKSTLHPLGGVLNFRLEHRGKSYVYATDVEGDGGAGDAELAAFARGADILAHDGQYGGEDYEARRKGWGHSTVGMAVRTARAAGVGRLVIIHHDPDSDDAALEAMEREARREYPEVSFAKEGGVLSL